MPSSPTASDLHVNSALTNMSIGWMQEQSRFAWSRVFPIIRSKHRSNRFFEWDQSTFFRRAAKKSAPGDEAPIGIRKLSTNPYFCDLYRYAELIADEERANADAAVADLDQGAAESVMHKSWLEMEAEWVQGYFQPSIWTGSTTGGDIVPGTKWDAGSSDPIGDLESQIVNLGKLIPKRDIVAVMGPDVWRVVKNHPDFLARYENTQAAILTEQLVARVLGIKDVVVPESAYDDSDEGQAADQKYFFERDSVLLAYAQPRPAINRPSAGYSFVWSGLMGSVDGSRVLRFRRDEKHSDQIESEATFDARQTAPQLGVFLDDVLT